MCTNVLCLYLLLICGSAVSFYLPLKSGKSSIQNNPVSGTVSEAIQKLQEVFSFGELPHNIPPEKKPPQFMLELYSRVADPDGSTKAPGLLEGNVVRSFENKVLSESGHPHFIFNISSVGNNEKMLKAELRIFKWKTLGMASKHHFCRIDVYELLESASLPCRGNLISSRLLPLHSQGWEMFNVTQTVSKWVGDNNTNHGFLVMAMLPSGRFLDVDLLGLKKYQTESKRSYLVLFSDDGRRGVPTSMLSNPIMKDTDTTLSPSEPQSKMLSAPYKSPGAVENIKTRQIRDVFEDTNLPCQRSSMYVDFEEIGWDGWIISPKGYNAYHCTGTCLFPLGQGLSATNHATVQSIVHALKLNKEISSPCCVPNKLNSINLLYFDDEENVVLKQYNDMVAVSCGCH
ncbi:bone morphogenetic protein 2-like [Spea bombifrons]|uniref:bone morphogenetic protein 2-like n=1 Tax=Spea bombifrons TaxID=233779 RepID=UPI00234B4C3A|nr:bone morphogenetic protein 2-like [Spea bombifrons]